MNRLRSCDNHSHYLSFGYDDPDKTLAASPGGVANGRLPEFDELIAIPDEGTGQLQLIDPHQMSGLGNADAGRLELLGPDHYAITAGEDLPGAAW